MAGGHDRSGEAGSAAVGWQGVNSACSRARRATNGYVSGAFEEGGVGGSPAGDGAASLRQGAHAPCECCGVGGGGGGAGDRNRERKRKKNEPLLTLGV